MTLLTVLHISMCIFLIGVILLQAGKGDMGIGFGSSSQSIFGSKGAGNFLTRTTSIVAAVFLTSSFMLTKCTMDLQKGMDIMDEPGIESTGSAFPKEEAQPKTPETDTK